MIDLRLLGSFEILSGDAHASPCTTRLGSKDAALLVFLALSRPRGPRSRDELVGMLWPEIPERRARAALSQALYRLRSALPKTLIRTRGDHAVWLDPELFRCDAVALDAALDHGRLEEAVDLYSGELLRGFHLADSPAFVDWLEGERLRLRTAVTGAAQELALRRAGEGNPTAAVHRLRQALAWSPYDEILLRELLGRLAAIGDLSGALREYEAFARRLDRDLDVAPSSETRTRAAEIRALAAARPPLPAAADPEVDAPNAVTASRSASSASPVSLPIASGPASVSDQAGFRPDRPPERRVRRSRSLAFVVAGLFLAAAALVAARIVTPERVTAVPARPARVAVLPFAVHGNERLRYLEDGVVDLLSEKLNVPEQLETVDPRALLAFYSADEPAAADPSHGRLVARRFDADLFVLGAIVEAGGRLEVTGTLYDAAGGELATASARVPDEASVFAGLDELARELLAGRPDVAGGDLARLAALTTASLPALKAYLAGERGLRAGRFDEAVEAFSRATSLDSAFAMAYYRLEIAASWAGRYDLTDSTLARAWRVRDRLPDRARLLLEARHATHRMKDPAAAERHFRTAVTRYPDDLEAALQWADWRFHAGERGFAPDEVRAGFEHVLSLDPGNAEALLHLARIAALQRRPAALDSLARRFLETGGKGPPATEIRALSAFSSGDDAERQRAVAEFRGLGDEMLVRLVFRVIAYTEAAPGTDRLATLLTEPDRPAAVRALGQVALAYVAAARGRPRAARDHLASAEPLQRELALAAQALLAVAPFARSRPELTATREGLAGWRRAPEPPIPVMPPAGYLRTPQTPVFLAGLVDALSGDPASALQAVSTLEGMAAADRRLARVESAERAERAAVLVRAVLADERDQPAEALRLLDGVAGGPTVEPAALGAWLLAEALRKSGSHREALRWHDVMVQEAPLSIMFLGASHLRRAELQDRLGNRMLAIEHYRRVLELWADAEPELAGVRARAADRLATLEGLEDEGRRCTRRPSATARCRVRRRRSRS